MGIQFGQLVGKLQWDLSGRSVTGKGKHGNGPVSYADPYGIWDIKGTVLTNDHIQITLNSPVSQSTYFFSPQGQITAIDDIEFASGAKTISEIIMARGEDTQSRYPNGYLDGGLITYSDRITAILKTRLIDAQKVAERMRNRFTLNVEV